MAKSTKALTGPLPSIPMPARAQEE